MFVYLPYKHSSKDQSQLSYSKYTAYRFIYDLDGFRNVVHLILLGVGPGFSATLNIHETTGEPQIKVQTGMFVHAFHVLK